MLGCLLNWQFVLQVLRYKQEAKIGINSKESKYYANRTDNPKGWKIKQKVITFAV